ncbi:Uncharacterised protein [uncultured archaeon]|nr:Uncharacterised protein [uncultured archaeon]
MITRLNKILSSARKRLKITKTDVLAVHLEEAAGCDQCVKLLSLRFSLRFIVHAVDAHNMDHQKAIQILERCDVARRAWRTGEKCEEDRLEAHLQRNY